MPVITSVNELLKKLSQEISGKLSAGKSLASKRGPRVQCGLPAVDELLPGGGFASGVIHEILSPTEMPSFILPALVARSAAKWGWIAWLDVARDLFPPALQAWGIPLHRLVMVRPGNPADELWAAAECLKCKGIGVCVAALPRLSRLEARRLQLAAETGGGMGFILRPARAVSWPYAAATRWLIQPAPGERMIQRWRAQLIHGHGGRVGKNVLLEMHRETFHVRAVETVADRQNSAQKAAASA